jgi:hypothetical protein
MVKLLSVPASMDFDCADCVDDDPDFSDPGNVRGDAVPLLNRNNRPQATVKIAPNALLRITRD